MISQFNEDRPVVLAILGMPGSGKSTICNAIFGRTESFNWMKTGDGARRLAQTDPDIQDALNRGEMAPRAKMNAFMRNWIREEIAKGDNILLDGYPRYEQQWFDLLALAQTARVRLGLLYLSVDKETVTSRMQHRGRYDDVGEAGERRRANFYAETFPVLTLASVTMPHERILTLPQLDIETAATIVIHHVEAIRYGGGAA